MASESYWLGLPAWAFTGWRGRYFSASESPLQGYSRVFNTVEGNTTFYRTPDPAQVTKWRAAVDGCAFKFCFKLPRAVTHERRPDLDTLRVFLRVIEPLGDHLGPLLVQFPASVGPAQLPDVGRMLAQVPSEFRCVVEVRHPAFFAEPDLLLPLLHEYQAGRVVMDTRPLYDGDRSHPEVLAALHEKPDLPVLPEVHNGLAFVRLVLHPESRQNVAYVGEWAKLIAGYLAAGHDTFMMIHCPNNLHCPEFAADFHRSLIARPGVSGLAELPPWPVPQQGQLL
ncbi:MAG: DUF72 domain-containing protein [Gammaproteobacteria bacterium]|nr:DUF72 domain-containing protein [Gammaproteobacteria bacterium]